MSSEQEMSKKVYLTFPKDLIQEPVIYRLGHTFQVVTNIRTASVSEEIGLVGLELIGTAEEIEKAIQYLRDLGVIVEPIEKSIVEG